MDFKGITWAGNIYQKFETMCLEVEEVMYEDTVKYVENQVQKVGVSVKKFYSEVMQDLVPPSCVDPMKVAAGDLSLKPYEAHTDFTKKPKLSILNSLGELKKRESEEDISGLIAEESSVHVWSELNHPYPLPPRAVVKDTRSEVCSTKSKKMGVYRRPIGIKRISQNNHPSKVCRPLSSLSEVRHDPGAAASDSSLISDNSFESHASQNILSAESLRQEKNDSGCTSLASDKISSAEPLEHKKEDSLASFESHASQNILSDESVRQEKNGSECSSLASDKISSGKPLEHKKEDSLASFESHASQNILSAESVRQEKNGSECTSLASDKISSAEPMEHKKEDSEDNSSCYGLPTEPIGLPMEGISFRSNACDVESVGQDVMTSYQDNKFRQNGSFYRTNTNIGHDTCCVESVNEEFIASYDDNFDVEVIESAEVVEPVEKSKLEETCILVEGDMLHFVSHGTEKHKSYKKKIREALSSKLRSTRKQDQFVPCYKYLGGKNNTDVVVPAHTMDSDKRKLPAQDSFESDWELL